MALPQEAIEIQKQRDAILVQVNELKAESRALKKQFDNIVEKANLAHKLGGFSDADKARLRELLDE